jgi:hypothetical protein
VSAQGVTEQANVTMSCDCFSTSPDTTCHSVEAGCRQHARPVTLQEWLAASIR